MQETWVWSLGQEDPLEKEMATHSRILAWRIPWTEEPGGLQSMQLQRVGHDCSSSYHILVFLCLSYFPRMIISSLFWPYSVTLKASLYRILFGLPCSWILVVFGLWKLDDEKRRNVDSFPVELHFDNTFLYPKPHSWLTALSPSLKYRILWIYTWNKSYLKL